VNENASQDCALIVMVPASIPLRPSITWAMSAAMLQAVRDPLFEIPLWIKAFYLLQHHHLHQ
jgi:hypothetical protein